MSGPQTARPAVPWMSGGGPAAVTEGTLRTTDLDDTWDRLAPQLRARGITRVADLTGLDILDVPVWTAIRPAAATLVASAGKGITHTAARISAVMESIEVAVAEQARPAVTARDSAGALAPGYRVGELSLHPVSLADDRTVLDWTTGWDLAACAPALVPAAAVGLRGWAADRWQPATFVTTTNGLASGNDHVEAALHALLEAVERDALARLREGDAIATDLDTLGGRLGAVTARIRAAGADVALERIPSVPGTWAYTCWLTQPEMWQIFAGSGCHTDPAIAAERALLEAVQSRGSTISGGRDDIPEWTFRRLGAPADRPRPAPRRTEPMPRPARPAASLRQVLDTLVTAVHHTTGRPVIAVDLTPGPQPWPAVVQVFAPGLGLALQHPRPQSLASRSFT
ncbi:YcaO-like family protein [Streptomyces rhizosphaerihabitans]|uniref:YcaO-like family protein n=1 Tax=Streptomyces rhizosphaerihabitans TaxID=1266770 RepID=UPI0021C158A4|nr:YcaO-like family protein [Streptomyces rhizosphaerihabitans]MCT9011742.1 YcaO-like family protein [Streptomyces rhizosphaerihabitans]